MEEPAITHSLRGMTYIEIELKGLRDDLHSGFWGGATHNPALALVEILSKLYNRDNTIAVPGFYEDVVSLTADERKMLAKTPLNEEQFKKTTGYRASGETRTTRFASVSRLAQRWISTDCGAATPVPALRRSFRPKPVPS
jgi:acetylornithine deacetylase/succinyl-diaminopimelate desuccinylase-like protein